MIKKLDLLIVKAFIGPFVATFFITLFVLVLQFFWLYIDDVVGKGIDGLTVGRLVFYLSATLVPLALPLAVLLSSIMTLGNLGETFELIAIKAAGISLLRFMRPLFFVSLALTILAFFFNNNILPICNLRMNTIKYDIIVTKPAFDIKEGVFYDRIEGFVIKIGKKEKDGSTIRNVVIYEQAGGQTDNVIIADSGQMVVTPDKQSLEFILKSGTRYQEQGSGSAGAGNSQLTRMSFKQYRKVMDLSSFRMNKTDDSTFKHNYQMLTLAQLTRSIDSIEKINAGYVATASKDNNLYMKFAAMLDTTGWQAVEKDTSRSKYLMSTGWATDSIRKAWTTAHHRRDSVDKVWAALKKTRDSLDEVKAKALAQAQAQAAAAKTAAAQAATAKKTPPSGGAVSPGHPGGTSPGSPAASPGHPTGSPVTSPAVAQQAIAAANSPAAVTPLPHPDIPGGAAMNRLADEKQPPAVTFGDLIPDSLQSTVINQSMTTLNSAKVGLDQPVLLYKNEDNNLRQHEIAWHEKITLAVAVMVMFLIGAPLGSIIRKGGIGLPLVFAVVFFVIFFLLNNFGKKFVKESVLTPIGGMWMATYVLTPIGLFLIYKAMNDSQLFNKEFYFRISRGVRAFIQKWRSHKKQAAV